MSRMSMQADRISRAQTTNTYDQGDPVSDTCRYRVQHAVEHHPTVDISAELLKSLPIPTGPKTIVVHYMHGPEIHGTVALSRPKYMPYT